MKKVKLSSHRKHLDIDNMGHHIATDGEKALGSTLDGKGEGKLE